MSEWVEEMRIRDLASRIRPEPNCVTWSNAVLLDALGEIDRLRAQLAARDADARALEARVNKLGRALELARDFMRRRGLGDYADVIAREM